MKRTIKIALLLICFIAILVGCGEDTPSEKEIDTTPKIEMYEEKTELALKEEYCLMYSVLNGTEASSEITSSDESIIRVDGDGYITGRKAGEATIKIVVTLTSGETLEKELVINVVDKTIYKITFQLSGGKCDVEYGEAMAGTNYTLPIPTKEHADFAGWVMSGVTGTITEVTNIKSNVTVRATWTEYYKLTYDLNGGVLDVSDEYVKEGSKITLATPTKEGNTFLGWSLTKNGTSYVSEIASLTSNVTIYANWNPAPIDINFELDGGFYNGPRYVTYGSDLTLGVAQKKGYNFLGWTLTKEDTKYVTSLTDVKETKTLYAHYEENSNYKDFIITNIDGNGIAYNTSLTLELDYYPTTLKSGTLSFESSDKSIFTVTDKGVINALKKGVATLKVSLKGTETITQELEINVYVPGHFTISYDTTSYCKVGETIKINASYTNKNDLEEKVSYESLNTELISVDSKGNVTGLKEGTAKVNVKSEKGDNYLVSVTVLNKDISEALQFVLDSHESNVFTRYNLLIGNTYRKDIIGSVTDFFYSEDISINRTYEAKQATVTSNHAGTKTSTEFICVHYTGNMAKGADGKANAAYFANGGGGTSIHYTTGNDGVYHILDDSLVGFHAGDGHTDDDFYWRPTGVKVLDSDPDVPVWGISENSKFTINGRETNQDVPEGKTEATKKVTSDYYITNGSKQKCINNMGLAYDIINGEYYMGTTWWCYTQVSSGKICNKGGNFNSVGIESCVNEGSDLWYTWHLTAKLVAQLMVQFDLDITRVVGHHFFTAKNCPQPMLENDLEIWYKFIELVNAEYARMTTLKDYTFKFEIVDGGLINATNERVEEANDCQTITYKVTITKGDKTETVVLSSVLNGLYSR